MFNKICFLAVLSLAAIFSGCSIISSNYIPSTEIKRQSVHVDNIQVYYDKEDVPFKYKEAGRIFLKNINYWADRDPAGQIKMIKQEAAKSGADAVIIIKEMRMESTFNASAGGNAGDVYQFSGIAIIKE